MVAYKGRRLSYIRPKAIYDKIKVNSFFINLINLSHLPLCKANLSNVNMHSKKFSTFKQTAFSITDCDHYTMID